MDLQNALRKSTCNHILRLFEYAYAKFSLIKVLT